MARILIREAHGGATREIDDRALPYFPGWVVLDTLDDSTDASPLYLSKTESDFRYAKTTDLGDPNSAAGVLLKATSASAAQDAVKLPFVQQLKAGDAYIADRLTIAPTYNIPTISTAATSQLAGGVLVQATGDYAGDTHFRYNGCSSVASDGTWVSPASGQLVGNQMLVPEFVTSEANFEVKVRDGRTGDIGLRVIVDGKLTSGWQMQRVAGTANSTRYVRLAFPDSRTRHIQLEQDGFSAFGGVVAASGAVISRPAREWSNRHVVIGDSLQAGAPTYDYLKYESHSRMTAFLLGADFYMNLGVGGTGWVADNGAANPFSARLATARSVNPQTVHVYGSRNDVSIALTTVRQAVVDSLALLADIPNVIVGAVAQAGYNNLSDTIRQAVVAAGRTYVDINALAQSDSTAPQGHPTLAEQQTLGKAAYSQLDRTRLESRAFAADASRPRPIITLATSGSPTTSGTSVTFTATLSQAQAGVVRFYDGTTLMGSGAVSGTTATYATTALPIGTHTVTARFVPTSPLVQAATSNAVTQVVAALLGLDDDFNRADGPVGDALTGQTWTVSGTGPVISGNALAAPSLTANRYVIADPGTLWGRHEFTMAGTYAGAAAMQFAHLNSNTNLFVNHNGAGWTLWSRLNASASTIKTGTSSPWVAGDIIAVTFARVAGDPNSADVTVEKNGTVVITATRVDLTPYGGSTFIGAGFTTATTAAKFDRIHTILG